MGMYSDPVKGEETRHVILLSKGGRSMNRDKLILVVAGGLFMLALAAVLIWGADSTDLQIERSRFVIALNEGRKIQPAVEAYLRENNKLPEYLEEIGAPLRYERKLEGGSGRSARHIALGFSMAQGGIRIIFDHNQGQLAGQTLILEPVFVDDDRLVWLCTGGTVSPAYRTPECRETGSQK